MTYAEYCKTKCEGCKGELVRYYDGSHWSVVNQRTVPCTAPSRDQFEQFLDEKYDAAFNEGTYLHMCLEQANLRSAELERENAELRKELIAAKDSLFKAHTQNFSGLNGSAERTCNEGFKRAYKFLNPDTTMQSAGKDKTAKPQTFKEGYPVYVYRNCGFHYSSHGIGESCRPVAGEQKNVP